jgi:hypothetical protein
MSLRILLALAASATLMDGARWVPAVITDWYNLFTFGLFRLEPKGLSIFYLLYVLYPLGLFSQLISWHKINIEF